MHSLLPTFVFLSSIPSLVLGQNATFDPLQYVDQLIGTSNGGNVFAGATLPYVGCQFTQYGPGLTEAGSCEGRGGYELWKQPRGLHD